MIFVDALFTQASRNAQAHFVGTRTGHRWCHCWTGSKDLEELHRFAARLGLKRSWFQDHRSLPHYDLTPSKRARALQLGASELSLREWFLGERLL